MKTCPVCDTDYPDQHTNCATDGAVLIVSQELAPGSLVRGKYRIVRKIGQGGMGVVYLAEDSLLGVKVALKFLAGDLGKDPRFIKRFRTEARAAYQLRHPNIAEVTNLDQAEDGSLFIAMEYIEGPSLRAVLDQNDQGQNPKGLAVPRALEIAKGIASGLAAAHLRNTVHRDIKPENVLITTVDGAERPKILDFGIAAVVDTIAQLSTTGGFLLTPRYAAPEQFLQLPASEIDGRTDLYALGCLLFEMLTGSVPFHATNSYGFMKQHLEKAPAQPSLLRPELQEWAGLDSLVLRLLAKEREDRPKNAAELLGLLASIKFLPTVQEPARPSERTPKLQEKTAVEPVPVPDVPTPVAVLSQTILEQILQPAPQPARLTQVSKLKTARHSKWAWGALTLLTIFFLTTGTWIAVKQIKAKAQRNAAAQQQAFAFYVQNRYVEAVPLYAQACDGGRADSCSVLGYMYLMGIGVAPDDARAVKLLIKSCDGGSFSGCVNLGFIYSSGKGVPEDDTVAARLYAKACGGGNAQGCTGLGNLYHHSSVVGKDDSKATALYSKGCDGGDGQACNDLGWDYEHGRGVGKNDARAAELYAKACQMLNPMGCSNLGVSYHYGYVGLTLDPDKAKQFLGKSCNLGYQPACDDLKKPFALPFPSESSAASENAQ